MRGLRGLNELIHGRQLRWSLARSERPVAADFLVFLLVFCRRSCLRASPCPNPSLFSPASPLRALGPRPLRFLMALAPSVWPSSPEPGGSRHQPGVGRWSRWAPGPSQPISWSVGRGDDCLSQLVVMEDGGSSTLGPQQRLRGPWPM